jgi:hypothetical protein
MVYTVLLQIVQVLILGSFAFVVALYPTETARFRIRLITVVAVASLIACVLGIVVAAKQESETHRLIDNVTGGDSYPVVAPGATPHNAMLWLWNFGDSMLTGVSVTTGCGIPIESQREIVGTVPAHQAVFLRQTLDLDACRQTVPMIIDGQLVASFVIQMVAQNGSYIEILQFKTGQGCTGIGIRSWVDRVGGVRYTKAHGYQPESKSERVYGEPEWGGNEMCPNAPLPPPRKPRIVGH